MIDDCFSAGFATGGDCFAPGNPHYSSSPAHMLFEAGRYAHNAFPLSQVKAARVSRGYSVRVVLYGAPDAILRIDYERRMVQRAS